MTNPTMLNKIAAITALLATLAALALFLYTEIFFQKDVPPAEEGLRDLQKNVSKITLPETYNLKKLIINIKSPNKRLRFLEAKIHLVTFKAKYKDELEKHEPIINDNIIRIASGMTPEELNTVAGKTLLESRIKRSINSIYVKPLVKKIYFSKFVIQ